MPREARIVIENVVHHIVARGVNGTAIFQSGFDKGRYLKRVAKVAREENVLIHGYCLMQNHVHFLLTPPTKRSLSRFVSRLHTWWAIFFNKKTGRTGHLFQARYYSSPLSDSHYWNALRYVEVNPVRAKLVKSAEQWLWSSSRANLQMARRSIVPVQPIISRQQVTPAEWRELLQTIDSPLDDQFRRALPSSRPVGPPDFILDLEQRFGRRLALRLPAQTLQAVKI